MKATAFHRLGVVAGVLALAACTGDPGPTSPVVSHVLASQAVKDDIIPGSYIVILNGDSTRTQVKTRTVTDRLVKQFGGKVTFRYDVALHGYAVDDLADSVAEQLAKDPAVAYVEHNAIVRPATVQINPGAGLSRLDQRSLPLDTTFTYAYNGSGVHVYIIDAGVDSLNPEFTGRLGSGQGCVAGSPYASTDTQGHGTSVASVAAGTTYGVAKAATIHSIRISNAIDGHSNTAVVNCGINWVASYVIKPAVVNFSYASVPSAFSTRDAINNVTGIAHVEFVKAAGNDAIDAYQDRGNRANYELVVGATDPANDTFAYFSDYGTLIASSAPSVYMMAPGVNVLAADRDNPGYAKYVSGTSFSAPYVAGVVATMLQKDPTLVPSGIVSALQANATIGAVSGVPSGTPNVLLFSNFL